MAATSNETSTAGAVSAPAGEGVVRTPERRHVGRSGLPGRTVESPFRWRPASQVPGAELSVEARDRIRVKDESSRRARGRARAAASTYVIGAR